MRNSLKELDRLLRGEATRPEAVHDRTLQIPTTSLLPLMVLLAFFYGACMGLYSLFKEVDANVVSSADRYWQLLAGCVKVPLLFCLTILVTFPSLYVSNALVGSRLHALSVFKLLIASLGVTLAVLASLGPIIGFFSVSTKSYQFMVLFNVLVFAVAGVLGLLFLLQTLNRMSIETVSQGSEGRAGGESSGARAPNQGGADKDNATEKGDSGEPGPLDMLEGHVLGRHVKMVFRCWVVVFGLVGAQMGWVLRPFIGNPHLPFEWFRHRESNFFLAVWQAFVGIVTGSG